MNIRTNVAGIERKKIFMVLVLALVMAVTVSGLYLASCTDTLEGDEYANQKPMVYFANIPPDGHHTGRNLIVYWYGTDRDGLIAYYRYHVALVSEVGERAPEEYILQVVDSEWTIINVEPTESNPQTAQAIPLTADVNDPVNTFVPQWVFLQAFDREGLGSDIIFRLFTRNDNPPQTNIFDFSTLLPFVDGDSGGIVAGVRMNWDGSDPVDYPKDPPELEFQWRLYGPYDSTVFARLTKDFIAKVFVTQDGKLYNVGDTFMNCDTFPDTIRCTTFVITPSTSAAEYGSLQSMFLVDHPDFIQDTALNLVADSSSNGIDPWITNKSTTIYKVYRHYAEKVEGTDRDTTVQMQFIFWVRSRDDARVADLVPAFDSCPVIRPRYERPVAVIDFTGYTFFQNPCLPLPENRTAFWNNAIHRWNDSAGFELSADYLDATTLQNAPIPLTMLLKHKVLILYDDDVLNVRFGNAAANIYRSIDAGVNVWLTMRASLNNGIAGNSPVWDFVPPIDYLWYFGVTKLPYSGWPCHAAGSGSTGGCKTEDGCTHFRIESFVGAHAIDPVHWPNLDIDTTLLRTRFLWGADAYPSLPSWWPCFEYEPEHPAFPEVDWAGRSSFTEVLYLYKSLYRDASGGESHPLGGSNYNMEGNPVAHRYNSGFFKTAHFSFTPLVIDSLQMQVVIDSVLNWLYDAETTAPTSSVRYPDSPARISISEARERYWRRLEERAKERELGAQY